MRRVNGRVAAAAATCAACLFGAGFALAGPGDPPPAPVSDAAVQDLEVDPVDVRADLPTGRPAALRPKPKPAPRPVSTAAPAPVSAPAPAVRQTPRPAATPRPVPVSTPRPVATPAPAAPSPKPPPAPKPPSYVGSGFDDSG